LLKILKDCDIDRDDFIKMLWEQAVSADGWFAATEHYEIYKYYLKDKYESNWN
jgi:hypothetical protein